MSTHAPRYSTRSCGALAAALAALSATASAQTAPAAGTPAWSNVSNGDIWNLNLGDVGVGTNNPAAKLDVNGSFNAAGSITGNLGMTIYGSNMQGFVQPTAPGPNLLVGWTGTSDQQSAAIGLGGFGIMNAGIGFTPSWTSNRIDFGFGYDSNPTAGGAFATPLSLTYDWAIGRAGVNTTAPQYELHVNGTVAGVGPYINLSDARFKTNVEEVDGALDTVLQLRGVKWDWRTADFPELNFNAGRQVGFLAQEVEEVLPEAVATSADGTKGVAYTAVVPVLVEAIQEQQEEIQMLATELAELRKELLALRAERALKSARTEASAKE